MRQGTVEDAISTLKSGGVIVYPTETVYGLGASIYKKEGIERIYAIKGRLFSKPVSVAVSSYDMIDEVAYLDESMRKIIEKILPGPVTVLLKKRPVVPDRLSAGSDLIGIRFPDHEKALAIIESVGPITSTSANISGKKDPIAPEEVEIEADMIVYGGRCRIGVSSTVVDPVSKRILRKGAGYERVADVL
ncbi:MAG: L-threonylcarbamoyladenylate synthase [Candidatus Syntropharchaeales archaeon]